MTYLIYILTISGLFFFIAGTIGILRMPDVFSRIHAAAKCDSLGAGLILAALILKGGFNSGMIKLLFIIGFLWVTATTAASAISSAARYGNPNVQGLENHSKKEEGDSIG